MMLVTGRMESVEATATRYEEAGRAPLQEQHDQCEDENLAKDRRILREILQEAADHRKPGQPRRPCRKILLKDLVETADAECTDHGAEEIADATDDNGHERVDDIALAEGRTDVANLAEERSGKSRESAAETKCE